MDETESNLQHLFRALIKLTPAPCLEESPSADFERDIQVMTAQMALLSLNADPARRLENFSSITTKDEPKTAENHNTGGKFKCPVCTKGFHKDRTMFGHTRIHHDKGSQDFINPSKKKLKPIQKGRAIPDLCKLTASWTKTKKQTPRKVRVDVAASTVIGMPNSTWNSQTEKASSMPQSALMEEEEVAKILIDMPNLIQNCQSHKRRMSEFARQAKPKPKARSEHDLCKLTTSWTKTKKRTLREVPGRKMAVEFAASIRIAMSNSTWNCQVEKRSLMPESALLEQEDINKNLNNMPNFIQNCQTLKRRMSESAQLANKKRRIEESAPSEDKMYICQICHMSFSSPQALGGHCSSHKMLRKNAVSLESVQLQSSEVQENYEKSAKGRVHIGEICGMSFEMGQQLGGHKRKHYKEPHNQN